jgi:hypothetical protein
MAVPRRGTDRRGFVPRSLIAWKPDAKDVLTFSGIALLALGAGMVYTPAAPIVVGVLFLLLARPWVS